MSDIAFDFDDVSREIGAFAGISEQFIDPGCSYVLPQLREQLRFIRSKKSGAPSIWGIPRGSPLRTIVSKGAYEQAPRRGNLHVYAEIASTWQISCPDEKTKKASLQRHFLLTGNASTRVEIFKLHDLEKTSIAVFHVDTGDRHSPGCHFHVQVLQEEHHQMFPKALSVPRFPSMLVTPCTVIEFVLAELFQSEWRKQASRTSNDMATWRDVQVPRFERFLNWQTRVLKQSTTSPWTHFKSTKPDFNLFVR
jgi:hypothetical protein